MAEDTKDAHSSAPGRPFPKGVSGNPGGRSRIPEDVKEMLRAATPKAAKVLCDALDAERAVVVGQGQFKPAEVEYVPDWDLRLKAANAVFDRLYGKPTQVISDPEGNAPVQVSSWDLTKLTVEELRALAAIRQKANSR